MTDAQAIPQSGGARPGAFAIWLQAVRAPSLSAAAVPVLLGTAVAARDGYFHGWRMLIALIGAVAIQAGTNLINDYYDFRSGADSHNSLGPSMVIQRGLLTPEQVWRGGHRRFRDRRGARPDAGVPVRMADSSDRHSQHRGRILLHRRAGFARIHRTRRAHGVPVSWDPRSCSARIT